jgi:hypothetical protein
MTVSSLTTAFAGIAVVFPAALSAQTAAVACPFEFDQTYEWDDAGHLVQGMREALQSQGIADDPGASAVEKGRRRVIMSGNDHVVIEESEGWVIEIDEAAVVSGKKPMARARKTWKRSYGAAIGGREYFEEQSSEGEPRRESKVRATIRSASGSVRYEGGPAPLHPTLAAPGTPGFTRGAVTSALGFRCVNQTWRPDSFGPVDERCALDLPTNCEIARSMDPMTLELSLADQRGKVVTHRGRTTALKVGAKGQAVDSALLVPPASFRMPPAKKP